MIPIYSKYLQTKLLFYFTIVYCIFVSIIWLTQSMRFLELVTGGGIDLLTFLSITGFLILPMSYVCIPLALLIGCVITFFNMEATNELLILKGMGLNNTQIYKAILWVISIIFVIHLSISLYMMPKCYQYFKSMHHNLKSALVSSSFEEGVFNTKNNSITVYVDRKVDDFQYTNIFIYDMRDKDKPLTIIAHSGELIETENGPGFILYNGSHQLEDRKKGTITLGFFSMYNFVLQLPDNHTSNRVIDVNEMFLYQLLDETNKTPQVHKQHIIYALQRVLWPTFDLILPLIVVVGMCSRFSNRNSIYMKPFRICLLSTLMIASILLFSNISLKTFHYVYLMCAWICAVLLYLGYKIRKA